MGNADRVLVCSSPSYDFAPGSVPANVRYIGPQLDDTADETPGNPWADPSGRPRSSARHAPTHPARGLSLRVIYS